MTSWQDIMGRLKAGETVSKKEIAELAEKTDNQLQNNRSRNTRLRNQVQAAAMQGGEELETLGTFTMLELARGARGDLKIKGRDPTVFMGLLGQAVGMGGLVTGKKWGRHVNALSRGVTLSGIGAMARELGGNLASRAKGVVTSPQVIDVPEVPVVQGQQPGARRRLPPPVLTPDHKTTSSSRVIADTLN